MRGRRLRSLLYALGVALALQVTDPRPAAADLPRPTVRARTLFDVAERLFRAGQFDRARRYYELAYRETPLPGLLLNMAQCFRNQDDCESALVFYRRFLAEDPTTAYRDEVERVMAQCVREMLPASMPTSLPAATQAAAPTSRPAAAPTSRPAAAPTSRPTRPPGGVSLRPPPDAYGALDVAQPQERPTLETTISQTSAEERSPPGRSRALLLWTGVGLTAAAVTVGAVTGSMALTKHARWQGATDTAERTQLGSEGRALSLASTVGFSVAGAFAVGTALAYLFYHPSRPEVSVAVSPHSLGLGLGGSF
jgi:tetratricopeptide (TPR) repeat protein